MCPAAAGEVIEAAPDRLLGFARKRHEKGLDPPDEEEMLEYLGHIREGVDGAAPCPHGGQGLGQGTVAREDDDAELAESCARTTAERSRWSFGLRRGRSELYPLAALASTRPATRFMNCTHSRG